jgi:hypothetical protein
MKTTTLCLASLLALASCGRDDSGGLEDPVLKPATIKPPAPTAVVGKCAEVAGTVEVHHAGLPYWETVVDGTELRADDWVRTQPGAAVELQFTNGAKLAVEENSVVVVELPAAPEGSDKLAPLVAISKGVVRGVAGDASNAPLLLRSGTKTQQVTAAKGQKQVDYRVRATDQGTEIAVTKGTAVVEQGTQKVELTEGRATMATETLSAALEIPDFPVSVAPGIDARAIYPSDKPLFLTWKPVKGISTYRVQLARDLSFSEDVTTSDVTTTSFELRPHARGLCVWRVASKGPGGVLSEYGFARRIYFEEERPQELMLTPEDGETFGYQISPPTILFQWQAAAGAVSYRLSISRSADPLDKPVVSETTDAQRLEVKKLAAGEYSWGVYVRPGMKPIFLTTRKLVVKQMAKPKVKTPNSIGWTE